MNEKRWHVIRIIIYLVVGGILIGLTYARMFQVDVMGLLVPPQVPTGNSPEAVYARMPSVTRAQFLDLVSHCQVGTVTFAHVGFYFTSKVDGEDYRISDGIGTNVIETAIRDASSSCGQVRGGVE